MDDAPRDFQRATAGVLNSLAFKTRELDLEVIQKNMIIRNLNFVKGSLGVKQAKTGNISSQIAIAYSLKRRGFSGWEEQQEGTSMQRDTGGRRKRVPTIQARGGSLRNIIKPNMRINSYKQMYKLSQFGGNLGFMLRVMASRGGGYFDIDNVAKTKRGKLTTGTYRFKPSQKYKAARAVSAKRKAAPERAANRGRMDKIQEGKFMNPPRRLPWRTMSLAMLKSRNNIKKIWADNINHIISRRK